MVNDWEKVTLVDHCQKIGSGATPRGGSSVYLEEGEIALIRSQNIYNEGFSKDGLVYITVDAAEKLKNVIVEEDDILLNITGDSVARVCMVDNSYLPARVNQHVSIIRPKAESFNAKFLRYYLTLPYMQQLMLNYSSAGATRKALTKSMIENLEVLQPSIEVQNDIAHILGTLDEKIELNRQMNETLEAIAQALFKSWFVDFDPVIDNALLAGKAIPEPLKERAELRQAQLDSGKAKTNSEINDLFPSEFEFVEELGWIPKGWEVKCFGDLLKSTIGGDWGKPEPDEKHTIPSVIIRGTDIPDLKKGDRSAAPNRWVEAKKLKTRKLEPYDIVIEISGGSPTQSTGRSIIINENLLERLGGTVEPASFCRRFTPIDKYLGIYAGIHLQKIYDDGKMWGYQNQSTGIANFQTTSFLEREILVLPNQELLVKYFELVNPLINKMTSNQQIELAKLRDTLLPKLMSGELRIPDAEKLVADV